MSHLKKISSDYDKAEVTTIFLHDRKTEEKINLLTVFELVPPEQQLSPLIGGSRYMERESTDGTYTIYITRINSLTVSEAIEKYENIEAGLTLQYQTLNAFITCPFTLQQEPPEYYNIL